MYVSIPRIVPVVGLCRRGGLVHGATLGPYGEPLFEAILRTN